MEIDNHALGSKIRNYRERAGISLKALADHLGISESQLSLLERGKRAWSEKLFLKVVDARPDWQ